MENNNAIELYFIDIYDGLEFATNKSAPPFAEAPKTVVKILGISGPVNPCCVPINRTGSCLP